MELYCDFENKIKTQENHVENQIDSSKNKTKEEPTWRSTLRIFFGVILITLGVISTIGNIMNLINPISYNEHSEAFNPHGLLLFYLCFFGGARLIKGTKDDQISLWKKFWVNLAAFFVIWVIICIVEELIFGHYLAGIYSYLICYISLIIVIETGVTNKIILRRQNKQNQEKNVTSAPSPKQTDSDSSTQTIEGPQLPPIPENEDDSK